MRFFAHTMLPTQVSQPKSSEDLESLSTETGRQVASAIGLIDENSPGRKITLTNPNSSSNFYEPDPRQISEINSKHLAEEWKSFGKTTFKPRNLIGSGENRLFDLDRYSVLEALNPSQFQNFNVENPMVLYDENKKQFGLLTGTVIVSYKDSLFLDRALELKGIEVVYHAEHIKRVYLKPLGTVNLDSWAENLSTLGGFDNLEFEVLRAKYIKN